MSVVPIVPKETNEDFRNGFNFAVIAIHDVLKNKEGYILEKLDSLLTSITYMIDRGIWWGDLKQVVILKGEENVGT
jgi:hypothetical protein